MICQITCFAVPGLPQPWRLSMEKSAVSEQRRRTSEARAGDEVEESWILDRVQVQVGNYCEREKIGKANSVHSTGCWNR